MDKKSRRHPYNSSVLFFFIVWRPDEGERGLRGKTDEGREAEKLNAKLLGLWEWINPYSLHIHKWSETQFKSKLSHKNYYRDE